jgi:dTDP-4-dehydrorhamnose 3,5-epimerase
MLFVPTSIDGAWVVKVEQVRDERGFFARTWCRTEFAARGLSPELAQCSIAYNQRKGTLRGMHFQMEPFAEAKLVRCTRGAIFDVIIDLRPGSGTFQSHFAAELTDESHDALYVPEGCAHGYLTLTCDTQVFYQMSQVYAPECAAGVRWDDPSFGIIWPAPVKVISRRDAEYADFVAST